MNRLERIEALSKAVKDHNANVDKIRKERGLKLYEKMSLLLPRIEELLEVRKKFEKAGLWNRITCSLGDDKITFDKGGRNFPFPNIGFSHISNGARYAIAITLPSNGYAIRFSCDDNCIDPFECDTKTMELFLDMYDDFEKETYESIDSLLDKTDKSLSESNEETYIDVLQSKGE